MSGIPADQVLAILRIKQWTVDRRALASGKTTQYKKVGWTQRNNRTADARIVRVADFDLALRRLSQDEQTALLSIYAYGIGHEAAAKVCHCSLRKFFYLLAASRQHLADVLGRLDLL